MRKRIIIRIFALIVKFVVMMFVMTVICAWAWDAFLNGKVYNCTDGGGLDYLFVGDGWVHAHDGHPIVVVPQIVPPHNMGDPDTIKQGWSVGRLWCVWILFFSASLVVSILFAWVSWIKTFDRLAERRHQSIHAV